MRRIVIDTTSSQREFLLAIGIMITLACSGMFLLANYFSRTNNELPDKDKIIHVSAIMSIIITISSIIYGIYIAGIVGQG